MGFNALQCFSSHLSRSCPQMLADMTSFGFCVCCGVVLVIVGIRYIVKFPEEKLAPLGCFLYTLSGIFFIGLGFSAKKDPTPTDPTPAYSPTFEQQVGATTDSVTGRDEARKTRRAIEDQTSSMAWISQEEDERGACISRGGRWSAGDIGSGLHGECAYQ